jgi:septation ring formation regulator EzrA
MIEERMQEAASRQELCRTLLIRVKKKLEQANTSVGRARVDLEDVQKSVASVRTRFDSETAKAIEKHLDRFKNVKRRKCRC